MSVKIIDKVTKMAGYRFSVEKCGQVTEKVIRLDLYDVFTGDKLVLTFYSKGCKIALGDFRYIPVKSVYMDFKSEAGFLVSTTGVCDHVFHNVTMYVDRNPKTGERSLKINYSVDGGEFNNISVGGVVQCIEITTYDDEMLDYLTEIMYTMKEINEGLKA